MQNNTGPMYKQIREDIVDDILSSVYEAGDIIPTQNELAEQYQVSRLTVRKALDGLIMKGILRTEKGKGTFVEEVMTNTYSYRRLSGLTSNIAKPNISLTSKTVSVETVLADKRLSQNLNISTGEPVVAIKRLRFANDSCISYQQSFLVKKLLGSLDMEKEDLESNSLYHTLEEKAGIVLGYVDEYFRAIRASEQIAEYFDMEVGDPILAVSRTAYDSNTNIPVEYCENFESTDVNGIWVKSVQF